MRHNIKPYQRGTTSTEWFILTLVVGVTASVAFLWGFIALCEPAVADIYGLAFLGLLPGAAHLVLFNTAATKDLSRSQRQLMWTWQDLPRELRTNIPMPYDEVKHLDWHACERLQEKMDKAVKLRQKETGRLNEAHAYLDAAIEQYSHNR